MYVFRNYTVENLFDEDTAFSGYDDISSIPADTAFLWLYFCPVGFDGEKVAAQVQAAADKLRIVADAVPSSASFYVFSMENLYPVNICDTDRTVSDAVDAFNLQARALASEKHNIKYVDFSEFLAGYPPEERISWRFYFISQMMVNSKLVPAFKQWWAGRRHTLEGKRKKCLVLDLDNTLWSGVLGEDGVSGVKMAGDYPGNAFHYFQCALRALAKSGVILTVCSKNNEEDVKELWEKNPFLVITPDLISAYRINWNNKADNIRELARELNIGLDSMVFIDDNPTERELVRQQLPMVEVPEFPNKPYGLMAFFAKLVNDYFRAYRLTAEDLGKTEQYRANARRSAEQSHFTNLDDFIRSLDIKIDIIAANEFNIERIAQMTQKTNQFNLTTRRYTVSDINAFIAGGAKVWCISVADKFGDNGITGEIIVKTDGDEAEIDTFLLSCRILGKKIERAFVLSVLDRLREQGIKRVKASFIPTAKNAQVKEFFDGLGFTLLEENGGIKNYIMELSAPVALSSDYTITFK